MALHTTAMTRYNWPSSVSLISWMVQMLGWSNAEAAWASCRNRYLAVSSRVSSGGRSLIATVRLRRGSRASYTTPMQPWPSWETISYGPSRVPGVSGMVSSPVRGLSIPRTSSLLRHDPQLLDAVGWLLHTGWPHESSLHRQTIAAPGPRPGIVQATGERRRARHASREARLGSPHGRRIRTSRSSDPVSAASRLSTAAHRPWGPPRRPPIGSPLQTRV